MVSLIPAMFRRALLLLCVACGFVSQTAPAQGFTSPTLWTLETLQDDDSEWWQSLRVRTVPGVVYQLQKSNTLEDGDWETLASQYGMDSEWICPVMPGSAPAVAQPAGTPHIPATPPVPLKHVNLILEKDNAEGTLASWTSLDNGSLIRRILPGVTLDPVWEEFDSYYLRNHGDYLFGISPRLHSPVNSSGSAPALGPLDTAMVNAFIAALPTIDSELETSVANAASYTPVPADPQARGFFRVHANWQVDSDGDGRLDWEEIIFDNNNPFCADSDGDGQNDVASDNNGPIPSLDDAPSMTRSVSAASPSPPLATIEQQFLQASREVSYSSGPDWNTETSPYTSLTNGSYSDSGYHSDNPDQQALEGADSFPAFADAVEGISFLSTTWDSTLREFDCWNRRVEYENEDPGYDSHSIQFYAQRARFRLKLDGPAPAGGYRIPLRIGKVYQSLDPYTGERELTASPAGDDPYVEINLEIAEGLTEGTPVSVDIPNLGENLRVIFIPVSVTTRDVAIPEDGNVENWPLGPVSVDGACVPPNGSFQVYFGGNAPDIEDVRIQWQKRRLSGWSVNANGEGTLGEWEWLKGPGAFTPPFEGYKTFVSCESPGVYQLQAVLVLPDGRNIEFPCLRMRDAKSIQDSSEPPKTNSELQAGKPDYFGVAPDALSLSVRNQAIKWLGSTAYRRDGKVTIEASSVYNPDTTKSNKCTIFVTHVANSVGATTPYFYRWLFVPTAPIARHDWFTNPEKNIDLDGPGWKYRGANHDISPGQVVANHGTGESGHAGIIDYDGSWISAGPNTVNKFIHFKNMASRYRPFAIRERP